MGFWTATTAKRPDMSIMPTPLSTRALQAISFGDEEYIFRIMAFRLSNAGDTFGRTTRLIDYDIKPVVTWFDLLDSLNPVSNIAPFMAAYYFGQSQNITHIRPMVDYLTRHSDRDINSTWWWRIQAAYLANHRLQDKALTLKISLPLTHITSAPLWVQQYPAFIYEQQGEMDAALHIIESIVKTSKDIPPEELSFMRAFVENRIKKLDELNPDIAKRLAKPQPRVKSSKVNIPSK